MPMPTLRPEYDTDADADADANRRRRLLTPTSTAPIIDPTQLHIKSS
jgi:hypothetical protein